MTVYTILIDVNRSHIFQKLISIQERITQESLLIIIAIIY